VALCVAFPNGAVPFWNHASGIFTTFDTARGAVVAVLSGLTQVAGGTVFFGSTRKFPRMSLDIEVQVDSFGRCSVLRSVEIGAGGMALKNANALGVSQPVQLSFTLPNGQGVTVQAVVWWKRAEVVGVRFDPADENRMHVQKWMNENVAVVTS